MIQIIGEVGQRGKDPVLAVRDPLDVAWGLAALNCSLKQIWTRSVTSLLRSLNTSNNTI